MAHIKNRLRGLLVAFVALVAALAIVPGVAKAASQDVPWTGSEKQTITISGLKGDATINIYEIGTVALDSDGSNQTTFNVTATTNNQGAAVKEYIKLESPTAAQTKKMLDSITGYGEAVVADADYTHADAQGTYASPELPAGLYYVEITDDSGSYTYQAMVAPVSPTSRDSGKSWVLVDPDMTAKVSSSEIVKDRVADTPVNLGDTVDFTVTVTLNQYMTSFDLNDTMNGLEYVAGTMEMYVGNEAAGTPAATGDDPQNNYYDVVVDEDDVHNMTVTFNVDYLGTLAGDTQVTVKYTAKVCSDAEIANDLSNKAYTDNNPEGSTVTIELGKAGVYKYEKDNVNKPLEGAIFQVFESNGTTPVKTTANEDVYVKTGQDGFAWTNEDACDAQGNPLTGEVILEQGFEVVFVETKAPAGYRLPSVESNKFAAETVALTASEAAQTTQIPNTPADGEHGVDLPETGGMGTVALTAAGVVLVAGAAAFIVRSRKEN